MENKTVEYQMNHTIQTVVNILYYDHVTQLLNQGYPQIPPMDIMGWYEIKSNERGVLSLSLGNYTMAIPSAHGYQYMRLRIKTRHPSR